jgi:hypothetical protein
MKEIWLNDQGDAVDAYVITDPVTGTSVGFHIPADGFTQSELDAMLARARSVLEGQGH